MPVGSKKQKRADRKRAKKLIKHHGLEAHFGPPTPEVFVLPMSRLTASNASATKKPPDEHKPAATARTDTAAPPGSGLDALNHDTLARIADHPVLRDLPASVLALFSSTRHTSAVSQAPLDLTNSAIRLATDVLLTEQRPDARFVLRGVRLSLASLDNALQSVAVAKLRRLDLSGCTLLKDISGLQHCSQLTSLDLSLCAGVSDLSPLARCTVLTILSASGCSAIESASPLGRCAALRRLDLSSCRKLADLTGLADCKELTELDLTDNVSLEDVSSLACCPALTELTIAKLHRSLDLSPLGTSTCLRRVILSDSRSLSGLASMARCATLAELQIARCETVHHLDGIGRSTSLRRLDAGGCVNLRDISELRHCTSLEQLDLRGCCAVDEAHVNALGACTALHTLHIHASKVRDIGELRRKLPSLMIIRR